MSAAARAPWTLPVARPEPAAARQNVLIVTYHFPPDALVGGMRWQKFAKYLPQFGWTPHVLTAQPQYYDAQDPARLSEVAHAAIVRTRVLPNVRTLLMRARRWFSTWPRLVRRERLPSAPAAPVRAANAPPGVLSRWLFSLLWVPDDFIGWFPPALVRGLRVCRQQPIAAIVSSGPPHTCHLVGVALHWMTGVPWIADFRDPWATCQTKPWFVRSALSDTLDLAMERVVVRNAAAVVVTTEQLSARLRDVYPDQAQKFVTITNGFDPDDFQIADGCSTRADSRFTVAHAGSIYGQGSVTPLLEATAQLVSRGDVPASRFRLVFAGDVGEPREFGRVVEALGLSTVVECRGRLDYGDTVKLLHDSDLLVLFGQAQPEQVPAKAFDYIAAGRHILAVTEPGATADLAHHIGGTVVSRDADRIAAAIRNQYHRWKFRKDRPGPSGLLQPDALRRYDRVRLTARLGALLDAETRS